VRFRRRRRAAYPARANVAGVAARSERQAARRRAPIRIADQAVDTVAGAVVRKEHPGADAWIARLRTRGGWRYHDGLPAAPGQDHQPRSDRRPQHHALHGRERLCTSRAMW
jgi:hypothetical protein